MNAWAERAHDPVDLLEVLCGIDSANPAMGGPGEEQIARFLYRVLEAIGCDVQMPGIPSRAGRPNLIASLPGHPDHPTVLLEAHLDTVAHARERQAVRRHEGRLYGRGACDTKGSAAAMVAAIARIAMKPDHPTVVFAGAADEEVAMTGSRDLVGRLPRVEGAIIGEPTSLQPVRVHNGLMRFRIVARGRAAHTSRAHLGVNAVAIAARVVLAIEDELLPVLQARAHPLAGPALITAAVIHGGVAPNLVPDWCEIEVDRRLAPGEDPEAALAEVDVLITRLDAGGAIVREEPTILLPAVETPSDHWLVRLTEDAVGSMLGTSVLAGGVPYGTDASNLSGVGGIPCVVLGPGSIDQAHTDDEWVPIDEVIKASRIYEELVSRVASGEVASKMGRTDRA